MHGYLWELVSDAWHDDYENAPADGSGWEQAADKLPAVARGGSWREAYREHRSAARRRIEPGFERDDIGFRCVKAAVKAAPEGN
jgi:formylglycine-generating enzyme required for sulfatase activity